MSNQQLSMNGRGRSLIRGNGEGRWRPRYAGLDSAALLGVLWGKLENQYRILGVEEDASAAEIKQAFREKAKRHHPDIAGEGGRERMQKLLAAYEILSNRERRGEYDRANRRRQWAQRTSGGSGKGFNYREYLYERTLEGDPQTREKAQQTPVIPGFPGRRPRRERWRYCHAG